MTFWPSSEGETPIDPSLLVDRLRGVVTNRAELIAVEFENVLKATKKHLGRAVTKKTATFDMTWMCRVHHDMFDDVWKWAGEIRNDDFNIGIPHSQVGPQLHALSQDIEHWQQSATLSVLEQSVHLHHRCAKIHPFLNGNGRWSRLLTDIYLKLHKQPVINWPNIDHITEVRNRYLRAMKAADQGQLRELMAMHEQYQSTEA